MLDRRPRTALVLAALVLPAVLAAARAARAEDAAKPEAALFLQGKLGSRTVTQDGERRTRYTLEVGPTTFEIDTGGIEAEALRKARGKYVTFQSPRVPVRPEGDGGYVLEGTATFEVQEHAILVGVVRTVEEGRKIAYRLENDEGSWQIARRDARRFKAFVDMQVAARCYRISDGHHFELAKVKDVERRLRPGERAPASGEEAIGASWRGTLTAIEVPKGIPGVKPGDFALDFASDAALEETTGRLMRTYDVVGLRLRRFHAKRRTATVELAYSFGQGSYAIMLEGAFSEDWKSFEGEWKSGFLGHGTFVLAFVPPETPDAP